MKRLITLITVNLFFLIAQGTTGAFLLDANIQSKSLAFQGIESANGTSLDAMHGNPAGLINSNAYGLSYANLNSIEEFNFQSLSSYYSFEDFSIGLMLRSFNSGSELETTVTEIDGTGNTFEFQSSLISLSVAKKISDDLSLGLSVKFLSESVQEITGSSKSIDLGLNYSMNDNSTLSLLIKNFGEGLKYENDNSANYSSTPLNQSFTIASSYKFSLEEDQEFSINTSYLYSVSASDQYGFSGEYTYKDFAILRGSYLLNNEQADSFWNGLALGFASRFEISADQLFELSYSVRFSNDNSQATTSSIGISAFFNN